MNLSIYLPNTGVFDSLSWGECSGKPLQDPRKLVTIGVPNKYQLYELIPISTATELTWFNAGTTKKHFFSLFRAHFQVFAASL